MILSDKEFSLWSTLYIVIVRPKNLPEVRISGISEICTNEENTPAIVIEEGVEDASRDAHLSVISSEVKSMFDVRSDDRSVNNVMARSTGQSYKGQSILSEDLSGGVIQDLVSSRQDVFMDSDVSFSLNDQLSSAITKASTVKIRN